MSMPLLLPHVRVLDKKYPPREAYVSRIDVSPPHWYWDGDFLADPFSRTPVFRWSPEGHPHTGVYVVARLLWCDQNPGDHKRLKLRNTCGVYACIDPSHWEDVERPRRYTLPEDADAHLMTDVYARMSCVHIVSSDATFMVCGVRLDISTPGSHTTRTLHTPLPGSAITCEACLRDWRRLGRALKEIS